MLTARVVPEVQKPPWKVLRGRVPRRPKLHMKSSPVRGGRHVGRCLSAAACTTAVAQLAYPYPSPADLRASQATSQDRTAEHMRISTDGAYVMFGMT